MFQVGFLYLSTYQINGFSNKKFKIKRLQIKIVYFKSAQLFYFLLVVYYDHSSINTGYSHLHICRNYCHFGCLLQSLEQHTQYTRCLYNFPPVSTTVLLVTPPFIPVALNLFYSIPHFATLNLNIPPPPCNELWHFVIDTIAKCHNSTQHSLD